MLGECLVVADRKGHRAVSGVGEAEQLEEGGAVRLLLRRVHRALAQVEDHIGVEVPERRSEHGGILPEGELPDGVASRGQRVQNLPGAHREVHLLEHLFVGTPERFLHRGEEDRDPLRGQSRGGHAGTIPRRASAQERMSDSRAT
ncbi:MAG TPA: hypothetical protein DD658_00165 [Deltaproteobacteria bacterium]|nr:hypothetical protein [Deltaproteobacteria bacterium]